MMTKSKQSVSPDWRGLCAEILSRLEESDDYLLREEGTVALASRARAVLARWGHQPAPPAAGEVGELVAWLRDRAESTSLAHNALRITRAADLLERQAAPVPVAVAEQWPEFSDCDPDDRLWCFNPVLNHWKMSRINQSIHTHWIPAHALPLPSGEVEA